MRRVAIVILTIFSLLVNALGADAGDDHDWRPHDVHHVLKVFDARGGVVGRLASYHGSDGVYLSINGAIVFAAITRH